MSNLNQYFNRSLFLRLSALMVVVTSLASCIATRKIVYVEADQKNKILKTYDLPETPKYKVEKGDRFFIKITDPLSGVSLGIPSEGLSVNETQQMNIIFQSPSVHDYLVGDNGKIDIPLLGELEAEGKTISELTSHIKESCKGYISNPSIKLYMTNYNVTVLGEVNGPGFYQLITENPTLFDAIGLAKDLTDFANRKEIKLIRKEEGKMTIHYIDVTSTDFIGSPYFYVQPNDVIHVAPLKVKKFSSDNALPLVLSIITTIITIVSITSR